MSWVCHPDELLAPTQQRPPETLYFIEEVAVQAWDGGKWDAALAFLQKALPLAWEMCYL